VCQTARHPPRVLQVPRVRVLVVGGHDWRVVHADLRWGSRYTADLVGDQNVVALHVVRIPIGAFIAIDHDSGLQLMPAGHGGIWEEADAPLGLEPIPRFVLMERMRTGREPG